MRIPSTYETIRGKKMRWRGRDNAAKHFGVGPSTISRWAEIGQNIRKIDPVFVVVQADGMQKTFPDSETAARFYGLPPKTFRTFHQFVRKGIASCYYQEAP